MKAQSPAGTRLCTLWGQDEPWRGLAASCGAGCAPGTGAGLCCRDRCCAVLSPDGPPGCPTPAPLELSRPTAQSKEAALSAAPLATRWDLGRCRWTEDKRTQGLAFPPPGQAPGQAAGSQPCPMACAPWLPSWWGGQLPSLVPVALKEPWQFSAVMLGLGSSGRAFSVPFPPLAGARAEAAWPWVSLAPGRVGAPACRAIKGLDTECCQAPPLLPSVQFV